MATKKEPSGTGSYVVLRDCAVGSAGATVVLDNDTAADLVRDGMIAPKED